MRLFACALLLAAAAAAAMPASAVAEREAEQSAKSPARAAGERFIAALNGDGSTESFVASSYTQVSLAREPAAERARQFDRLKSLAGGFDVLEWRPQGERMVEILAVSRRGNRHAKFVLFTSGKEPGKVADIFVLSERDPARAKADAFPESAVTDEELARLVRRRLDALAGEGRFSGAILVGRGDEVLLREARGMADEQWRIANRVDTKFNVASIGKMWTAVAVLKLAEQGKLSLDDRLAQWVPSYPHKEAASRITLRQLFHHRAGLGEWDGRLIKGPITATEAAASMTEQPGEPDKGFSYSNAGYVLLSAAAEKASGLSFEQLMDEYVFRPAGMKNSGFWPVTAIVPNRATGYLRPADDPLGFGPKFANDQFLGYGGNGSGGAYSTVDDLFAFHRALATGRLLKPETVKMMIDTSVEFAGSPRPWRYGLGLRLEDCAGVATLGHGGGGPNSGASSATFATLDGSWTVIVLGNTDPPTPEDLALDVCKLAHRS